ncbi:MAG TPA: hypothetical protein PLR54_10495 [Spirochaetota bacterium]|jgi:hypothetical protein|nr:hypothetical protein [Spirochaetota bacterium]HOT20676.1 hypothetical protein [Spirochaetota bacterium]HQK08079.1 hypothetical protein [Spirochaetota bacterium]
MKKAILTLLIILFLFMSAFLNGDQMKIQKLPLKESPIIRIFNTGIEIPLGYFALVKRNNKICAIRFLETGKHPKKDKNYAIYEYYFQCDGRGDFLNNTSKHGTGKATYKSFCIIGRLCFNTGNMNLACGEINIKWTGGRYLEYGDGLNRNEKISDVIKAGVQIAPTKWTDIKAVNVLEKGLKWYKYGTLPEYPEYQRFKVVKNIDWPPGVKIEFYEIPAEDLW